MSCNNALTLTSSGASGSLADVSEAVEKPQLQSDSQLLIVETRHSASGHCQTTADFGVVSDGILSEQDKKHEEEGSLVTLTSDSTWSEVQEALGPGGLARSHIGGSVSNDFGYIYGYRGICLEVMQNGRLASITLFKPAASSGKTT